MNLQPFVRSMYIFPHVMNTNRRRIQTQTNWTFDVDYRQRTTEYVPNFTRFTHWHGVPCKTKIEVPELQT